MPAAEWFSERCHSIIRTIAGIDPVNDTDFTARVSNTSNDVIV